MSSTRQTLEKLAALGVAAAGVAFYVHASRPPPQAGPPSTGPQEGTLAALRPGQTFPLPIAGVTGAWTVLQSAWAPSVHPLVAGVPGPCRAYAIAVSQVDDTDYVLGLAALFCAGRPLPFADGPFATWAVRMDPPADHVALTPSFADALRPDEDVLQIREAVAYHDGTLGIVEHVFAAAGGRAPRQVLQTVGADPAAYAVDVGAAFLAKQTRLIETDYASGFPGSGHPRDFVYGAPRLLPDGRTLLPTALHASWDAAQGRFVEPLPTLTAAERAVIDAAARAQVQAARPAAPPRASSAGGPSPGK